MTPRNIVRDPAVLDGRWRLEGTQVPIAEIRRRAQFGQGRDEIKQLYAAIGLTDDEIDASMEFPFPAIRKPSVDVRQGSATVHCECGEDTPGEVSESTDGEIECPCGRVWRVTAKLEHLSGPEPTPLPEPEPDA